VLWYIAIKILGKFLPPVSIKKHTSHLPHVIPQDAPLLPTEEIPEPHDPLLLMGVQTGVQVAVQVEALAQVDHSTVILLIFIITVLCKVGLKGKRCIGL